MRALRLELHVAIILNKYWRFLRDALNQGGKTGVDLPRLIEKAVG